MFDFDDARMTKAYAGLASNVLLVESINRLYRMDDQAPRTLNAHSNDIKVDNVASR